MKGRAARRKYFKRNAYLHLKNRPTLLTLAVMTALVYFAAVGIRSLPLRVMKLYTFSFTSERWQESVSIAFNLLADFILFLLLSPMILGIFHGAELALKGEKITCGDTMFYFSSGRLLKFAYSYAAMWLVALYSASKIPMLDAACSDLAAAHYPAYAVLIKAISYAVTAVLWLMMAYALSRTLTAPTILRENPLMTFSMTLRCSIRASKEQSGEHLVLLFSFVPHLLPMIVSCGASMILTIPVLALAEGGMNEWIYSLRAEAIESGAYLKKYQYTIRRAGMKRIFAARQGKE